MSTARNEILQRIAHAKGASTADYARLAYDSIERNYQQTSSMPRTEIIDLFVERMLDYDAHVYRAREKGVADCVRDVLRERGVERILVPSGLPEAWMHGAQFFVDAGEDAVGLDAFSAVMTGATIGIAETGTVVLQNAPAQGRRALTLVPDYHLCILKTSEVVETVVEAMRLLEPTKHLPTTFFSGPSATADIEMTRIKGVHGPRFVDVILVVDEQL